MNTKELAALGLPRGSVMELAKRTLAAAAQHKIDKRQIRATMTALVENPEAYRQDAIFGELAAAWQEHLTSPTAYVPREKPAPFEQWGDEIDAQSIEQMRNACSLPISVAGALMPDAHVGYGLPIGGVLATRNAVIPYAVGVDIACRMKLTVLDLPVTALQKQKERLAEALEEETAFGVGATFRHRREHAVMDADWHFSPVVAHLKDKAWAQLGTSGSGNHFVEFGLLTIEQDALGLASGVYLALLSHSGSRGTGNEIATYYSRLAMEQHADLPRELSHLAWLDCNSHEGQEYWQAMTLMGEYAAANHELIHRNIARHLGATVLFYLENHHNFAWREQHGGEEVIVHRKGATPAGMGVMGVIPGSMATPGYVVRGKGNPASLDSASHGAGRAMSRKKATETYTWKSARPMLVRAGVTVLSAGVDEVPMVYKDIAGVMRAQRDLVEPLARFDPKIVKMAQAGERAED
ncbi:MAG TPA: RtcB family protein [Armatimonadota bacterium]|nr:RtcB family protein [Armatimonadota bacterium]